MNFMEAVSAMKQGKKVRREIWNPTCHYKKCLGSIVNQIGEEENPKFIHIEATDWEVVDEDWNLADYRFNGSGTDILPIPFVKKCRDLIMRDLDMEEERLSHKDIKYIINKRFGDLK